MSRDKKPHVKFFQGELCSRLPITAWESFTHALQSGAEWWEGEGFITDVRYMTLASLEGIEADTQEDQFA